MQAMSTASFRRCEGLLRIDMMNARSIALLARFASAGLANTAVGTSVIMTGLHFGLGDYAANAAGYGVGMVLSYILQRKWVFATKRRATLGEVGRFGLTVGVAYGMNLAVLAMGRAAGFAHQPLLHLTAMLAYFATFFLISRVLVFPSEPIASAGDPL